VPQKFRSAMAQECYRRAMEARRLALAAGYPAEKADLLEVEQGWLSLARSHEPEQWSEDNPEDDQGENVRGRSSRSGRARSR
jgi:hypothetical protein